MLRNFANFLQKTAERDSVTRLLAIFLLKDSTWASYEQTKMVPQTFLFLRRYLIAKFDFYFRYVGFHIFKLFISPKYLFAWLFLKNRWEAFKDFRKCPPSQRLCWHLVRVPRSQQLQWRGVCVFNVYADIMSANIVGA